MNKVKENKIIVTQEMEGTRVDLVASLAFEKVSRNFIQKTIENSNVLINDKPCLTKNYKVKIGDEIKIQQPEPKKLEIKGENIPIEIIYEDEELLVVNKPKGMVVHPAPGNYSGTLVNALMYKYKESLSSINGVIRPGIVHRID